MRVLGVGDHHNLGDLYWRLARAGHEVRAFVANEESHDIFDGLVERSATLGEGLDWIRAGGDDALLVFETADRGEEQERLRREGFRVFGGSAWGDRLENDRVFGQQVLHDAGLRIAESRAFTGFAQAREFLVRHPGRYVLKFSDPTLSSTHCHVGELESGEDLVAVLWREEERWNRAEAPSFILMRHLSGIEMGIGAFFNGERFLGPAVLDWEHKRFFPGNLGEMTGEMGTVVTYRDTRRFFEQTLGRLADAFRAGGYVGYVNLNTIVNEEGIWPLEFTSRFGYPGFAICDALHVDGWAEIFGKVLGAHEKRFATRDGFAVGVVLTVPPFPYEGVPGVSCKGLPLLFRESPSVEELDRLHHCEVRRDGDRLVTAGTMGYVSVATGVGADLCAARHAAYDLARKVAIPNLRYRVDIGERLMQSDYEVLARWGMF